MAYPNPWKFLEAWARENVHATVYNDGATAECLAFECRRAAEQNGISGHSIVKAAGGNLESFMLSELNSAVNTEVDRLVGKEKT